MKLTEDLYAFVWRGYENNCNSFYFGGEVGALIDVGHLRFVDGLLDGMRAEGITPSDLRLLILTHSHPDHMEAVARSAELGVPIAMHSQAVAYLEEVGAAMYQWLGSELPSTEGIIPLEEGPVALLDGRVEVYHTPGHEPGSLCVYWPAKRALATGDLVFAGGVGRTDFPGGDQGQLIREIERMAKLDVEYVLPGHGPVITGEGEVARNYDAIRRMFCCAKKRDSHHRR